MRREREATHVQRELVAQRVVTAIGGTWFDWNAFRVGGGADQSGVFPALQYLFWLLATSRQHEKFINYCIGYRHSCELLNP